MYKREVEGLTVGMSPARCCWCAYETRHGQWQSLGRCFPGKSPQDPWAVTWLILTKRGETPYQFLPGPPHLDSHLFAVPQREEHPSKMDTSLKTPHSGHVPLAAEDPAQLGSLCCSSHTCSPGGAVSSASLRGGQGAGAPSSPASPGAHSSLGYSTVSWCLLLPSHLPSFPLPSPC